MNYRTNKGMNLVRHRDSILPEYTPVGSTILPRYFPLGNEAATTASATPVTPAETPEDAANAVAIRASLLFFVGLALGYIWGGTTSTSARR